MASEISEINDPRFIYVKTRMSYDELQKAADAVFGVFSQVMEENPELDEAIGTPGEVRIKSITKYNRDTGEREPTHSIMFFSNYKLANVMRGKNPDGSDRISFECFDNEKVSDCWGDSVKTVSTYLPPILPPIICPDGFEIEVYEYNLRQYGKITNGHKLESYVSVDGKEVSLRD